MENYNFKTAISKDATKEQIDSAIAEVKKAVAAGYTPNAFAIKLPVGTHTGKATGERPYLTWKKTETNKGIILSVVAVFDIKGSTSITERVNCMTVADWEKFGKGSDITVTVTVKDDGTKVAKIVANPISDEIPTKKGKGKKENA
jgi:hypothetical protein